jgi:Tfp pilus assembly protein PilO
MARAVTGLAYFTLAITIIAGFFFVVFVIFPSWNTLQDLKMERERVATELELKQQFLRSLDDRLAELAALPEDETLLGLAFPDAHDTKTVLVVLQEVVKNAGGLMKSVSEPKALSKVKQARAETAKKVPKDLGVLEFQAKVVGSYAAVRNILRALERSPRFMDVQNIELTSLARGSEGEVSDMLELKLTIWTYVQKETKAAE